MRPSLENYPNRAPFTASKHKKEKPQCRKQNSLGVQTKRMVRQYRYSVKEKRVTCKSTIMQFDTRIFDQLWIPDIFDADQCQYYSFCFRGRFADSAGLSRLRRASTERHIFWNSSWTQHSCSWARPIRQCMNMRMPWSTLSLLLRNHSSPKNSNDCGGTHQR